MSEKAPERAKAINLAFISGRLAYYQTNQSEPYIPITNLHSKPDNRAYCTNPTTNLEDTLNNTMTTGPQPPRRTKFNYNCYDHLYFGKSDGTMESLADFMENLEKIGML